MTIYYTGIPGRQVDIWLTGAEVTLCVNEGRVDSMRIESSHALDFTPKSPGGPERIGWKADAPEPEVGEEVIVELPAGMTVVITDLADYKVEGDKGALTVIDMRT